METKQLPYQLSISAPSVDEVCLRYIDINRDRFDIDNRLGDIIHIVSIDDIYKLLYMSDILEDPPRDVIMTAFEQVYNIVPSGLLDDYNSDRMIDLISDLYYLTQKILRLNLSQHMGLYMVSRYDCKDNSLILERK